MQSAPVSRNAAPMIETADLLPGTAATPSTPWQPALLLREQTARETDRARPVLYVHGATFPSDCSIMFRFGGLSWADALNRDGFAVFGFDFAGFGGSERYPEMAFAAPPPGPPLGRVDIGALQVERAALAVLARTGAKRLSLVAHSWGTMPAARFAAAHPELVARLVFFGPIVRRMQTADPPAFDPWRRVTLDEQFARFTADVPPGRPAVLEMDDWPAWSACYLASDPASGTHTPPAVKTPNGPVADIAAAWAGRLGYDPAQLRTPVAMIRGEWDSLSTDADAAWLRGALTATTLQDVVIKRGTHLMHLEQSRHALYAETSRFLKEAS